jgi:hypothetical protein
VLLGVFVTTAAAAAFRPLLHSLARLSLGLVSIALLAWFSWDIAQALMDVEPGGDFSIESSEGRTIVRAKFRRERR